MSNTRKKYQKFERCLRVYTYYRFLQSTARGREGRYVDDQTRFYYRMCVQLQIELSISSEHAEMLFDKHYCMDRYAHFNWLFKRVGARAEDILERTEKHLSF